jgi:Ulp1 family protease
LVGKEVSILDKAYLLLPIIAEGHWSLAIFCHPGGSKDENGSKQCLLHLDSSPGIHVSKSVFSILRRFLKAVWEHWKGADEQFAVEDIAECTVPVPSQPNTI